MLTKRAVLDLLARDELLVALGGVGSPQVRRTRQAVGPRWVGLRATRAGDGGPVAPEPCP